MKDKEKQIQEIAQIICGRSKDDICIIDNTSCNSSCYWARKAEAIYNVGYRKYPEDSVVLSKEEYKRITKELVTEQRATEIATEYFEKIRKETAEKIYLQAKAIVELTKYMVRGGEYIHSREYIHIDALKEIIKNCGIEIKE